jgi:hypothetical protein
MNIYSECDSCPFPKKRSKYTQGKIAVCERCFSNETAMTCLQCNRTRHPERNYFMMACPCYDHDVSDDSDCSSDCISESQSDGDSE